MSRHLSSQQMSEWALGTRSPEVELHMRDCPACRAEADRFGERLAGFRDLVRHWSERQIDAGIPRVPKIEESRPRASFRSFFWASISVAVFAAVGYWAVLRHSERGVVDPAVTDVELLQQVDQAVSRSVPPSLEPLVELVSLEGA
jgi:hypothetical protein